MSKLAIHGGEPVRTKPFPKWPRPTPELMDSIIGTVENENWGVGSEVISRFEENRALSITANSKINKESNDEFYRIRERNDGSYYRKFDLPENVVINKINAQFNNGALTIKLPKAKEVKSENRKIKIS